ncbi:glycerol-3-phosphate responsive antiterminator [Ammoniphilus sp. 3BR4]|uniref:glycerol-3-phosphate responsive antiterminator n=1 Tax=Ammoniphilus sp. 3BR4 TaxID=3158265 RepID=UPI00346752D9
MDRVNELLEMNPVIAAVRDVAQMEMALQSPVEVIFLMTGDIFSVRPCVEKTKDYGKSIFLHIDLIKGVANDKEGIKYLAREVKPNGVVTTKNHLIQAAKREGLIAVQHLFLIDTHAFDSGIRNVLELQPDAVELMPGLMPRVIREFSEAVTYPIITAGLIKDKREIQEALNAGARGVAVGTRELWEE